MSGTLYIVATPIGNLSDISKRALDTLHTVDFIAAEDTRVTVKLLNHFNIKKPLVSYYEHNREESGQKILSRILSGESCALVSDAGTPVISDPGEDLVKICADSGVSIITIPGPCAAISALTLSGLTTGRFTFEGFLSTSRKSRATHLEDLKTEPRTMIFYEAPHKLRATLRDMLEAFGDRPVSISRELTKIHEETIRFSLSAAVDYYEEIAPRGEFVLIIEGCKEQPVPEMTLGDALDLIFEYCAEMSLKDAVKKCADETGLSKNTLYSAAIKRNQTT